MMNTPLVSIITPCYNAELYITEAIESVEAQTYEHWEMLIVDDASTDNSREIIRKYVQKDSRIRLIENQENMGTAKSRNRAISEAKGAYIALLDNDDIWLHQKLKRQLSFMQNQNISFCFSAYFTIDKEGRHTGYFPIHKKVNYEDMLKTSSIGTLTMIYDVQKLGKFYFHQVGHEDYVMKLEMLKKVDYAYGIDEPLAKYRIVKRSLSSNKLKAAKWQWKIYREVEKLSLFQSILCFATYTYYGFTKYKNV